MTYYIRTSISPDIVLDQLKYYMNYYKPMLNYYIKYNNHIREELSSKYSSNLIYYKLKNKLRCIKFSNMIVCIFIDSHDRKFNSLLQLLEYGKLGINQPKIISNYFNSVIQGVKTCLGGL